LYYGWVIVEYHLLNVILFHFHPFYMGLMRH